MAKRKKRRSNLPARRSSTSIVRRSTGMRKRRRRGLSAKAIPIIGDLSLSNPLIGGAVGGFGASLLLDEIDDTFFGESTDPESIQSKIKPFAKAIVGAGAAFLAKRAKQPEIAAGIMGVVAAKTREKMKEYNMLDDGGGSYARNIRFADASLLSDARLLSRRR